MEAHEENVVGEGATVIMEDLVEDGTSIWKVKDRRVQ